MRKLGINFETRFWPGIDEQNGLSVIKDAGFDCFFTDYYSDERILVRYARASQTTGLFFECMHAPYEGINAIWRDGEDGDAMLDRLLATVRACSHFKVPFAVVHLSSSTRPPCICDVGHRRIDRLVKEAIDAKVTLCFENLRKLANMAFVFEEYTEVPQVRFCWDTGHEACLTPGRKFMPIFGDKLGFTHIHDNLCEYNGDLHMIPFDGKIDFHYVADQIKKSGFDGTLSFEVIPTASTYYHDVSPQEYYARAFKAACCLREMIDNPDTEMNAN